MRCRRRGVGYNIYYIVPIPFVINRRHLQYDGICMHIYRYAYIIIRTRHERIAQRIIPAAFLCETDVYYKIACDYMCKETTIRLPQPFRRTHTPLYNIYGGTYLYHRRRRRRYIFCRLGVRARTRHQSRTRIFFTSAFPISVSLSFSLYHSFPYHILLRVLPFTAETSFVWIHIYTYT